MPLQVQQLLTQVDQLTDDREALDKQVIPATLLLQEVHCSALVTPWYISMRSCAEMLQIPRAVQVQYLTEQNGYISDKCDQKEAQVSTILGHHHPVDGLPVLEPPELLAHLVSSCESLVDVSMLPCSCGSNLLPLWVCPCPCPAVALAPQPHLLEILQLKSVCCALSCCACSNPASHWLGFCCLAP